MDALDRINRGRMDRWRTLGAPGWVSIVGIGLLAPWLAWRVPAQISGMGRGKNFVAPVTDAQGRKTVLRGDDARPGPNGLIELTQMKAETYRGQEKDMMFEAPKCLFDPKANVAFSSGTLVIRTADRRFSLEGEGFRWQLGDSGLTSKLSISNQVHSVVRKRLLGAKASPAPGATPAPPPDRAMTSTNEFIEVASRHFEYQADLAAFSETVRAHDVEGDLTCELLKVGLTGENGALDRIEAERDVMLQQANNRIIADKAVYTVSRDKEVVEFRGHALWSDGFRQGSGERVTFDRRQHILHAEENAYLKLPRASLGEANFLSSMPARTKAGVNTNAFVEVFSEVMTMQLPPTNGPVQRIIAERSVLIVDPEQDGRALADRADYDEATGLLQLTGRPLLETAGRLINGKTILFDRATQLLKAGPDAYVKLPLQALAGLGLFPESSHSPSDASVRTNWFVELWSDQFEYGTNFLRFLGEVRANFLEGDTARAKLTCDLLTVRYGEQVESLQAEKEVEFEQFARNEDPHPVSRKISSPLLRVKFTPLGRLEMALAEQGVHAEQEEVRPDSTGSTFTRMTAETATAFFSSVTNQLERLVAQKDVLFIQGDLSAHGAKAVYTQTNALLELTGQPTASLPEGEITEADRLIWDRVHSRFLGKGKFKSNWKRPAGATNQLAAPTARSKP
jgi:lipopolysaccharide export system protein LptA